MYYDVKNKSFHPNKTINTTRIKWVTESEHNSRRQMTIDIAFNRSYQKSRNLEESSASEKVQDKKLLAQNLWLHLANSTVKLWDLATNLVSRLKAIRTKYFLLRKIVQHRTDIVDSLTLKNSQLLLIFFYCGKMFFSGCKRLL